MHARVTRDAQRFRVARVRMAGDARTRVVREDALELLGRQLASVGDNQFPNRTPSFLTPLTRQRDGNPEFMSQDEFSHSCTSLKNVGEP